MCSPKGQTEALQLPSTRGRRCKEDQSPRRRGRNFQKGDDKVKDKNVSNKPTRRTDRSPHCATKPNTRNTTRTPCKRSKKGRSEIDQISDGDTSSSGFSSGNSSASPKSMQSRSTTKSDPKRRNRKKKEISRRNRPRSDSDVSVEVKSQFIAMDCEMVGTGPDGNTSTLARVSLVDWDGDVVLDTFVKVRSPVTDLRTFVSGVTKDKIDPENPDAMEFEECVDLVKQHIEGKVVVGHALKNDFRVLQIKHPWYTVRDTAKYEPFMKVEGDISLPRKLRELAEVKLGLSIQNGENGHSSVEDANAAMLLYKLVRVKWEKVMEYKMKKTLEIMKCESMEQSIGKVEGAAHSPLGVTVECR